MRLPQGPELPAAVQIARFRLRPFEFLDECARRHGDLFTLRFPFLGELVCASRPESIRRIFAAKSDELRLGEGNALMRPLFGERSLPVLDGADHQRLRRLAMPLLQGEALQAWSGMMLEGVARMIDGWREGSHVSLRPQLEALMLELILRSLFGVEERSELDALAGHARRMVRWSASPAAALLMTPMLQRNLGPLTPWRAYQSDLGELTQWVRTLVERRRRAGDAHRRVDMLSRLLTAADQGAALDDKELLDLLLLLVFAGSDTTASALCWAFEALLAHPEEMERLRQELASVTGHGPLEAEHLPRLARLDATIMEVLRLYPVVPLVGMGRKVVRPFELQGVTLPRGVKVVPMSYVTQRRADLYPDPERFRPERFLGTRPDPGTWLPFGGGLRRCLGQPLALHQMRVVLAAVLHRTRLSLVRTAPPRSVLDGVAIAPEGGTPVRVERVRRREEALGRGRSPGPRRPLGNTERLIWEFNRIAPLGTSAALHLTGPMDGHLLERALALVQERHPLLRARVDDSGTPAYTEDGGAPIPLSVEPRRDASHWLEALEADLNQLWPPHGPLARVRLLSDGDAHDIILGLHHMMADGMSAMVLARELLACAAALSEGRPLGLEQAPERPALEDLLPPQARGASGLKRAAGVAGEWGVHALRGLFIMPAEVSVPPGQRRTRLLRLELTSEETALLGQRCRERGTTVHGALCAAMAQSLVAAFRHAPENRAARAIACISPVNLRRMLEPAIGDEVGLYITPFGTAHPLSQVGDFWSLARAVRRELKEAMDGGAVFGPLTVQRALPPLAFMQERALRLSEQLVPGPLTVTNIGRVDEVEAGPFKLRNVAGAAPIGAVAGSGVALAVLTYAGIARLHLTYPEPLVSSARAESLARDALRRLRAAL